MKTVLFPPPRKEKKRKEKKDMPEQKHGIYVIIDTLLIAGIVLVSISSRRRQTVSDLSVQRLREHHTLTRVVRERGVYEQRLQVDGQRQIGGARVLIEARPPKQVSVREQLAVAEQVVVARQIDRRKMLVREVVERLVEHQMVAVVVIQHTIEQWFLLVLLLLLVLDLMVVLVVLVNMA